MGVGSGVSQDCRWRIRRGDKTSPNITRPVLVTSGHFFLLGLGTLRWLPRHQDRASGASAPGTHRRHTQWPRKKPCSHPTGGPQIPFPSHFSKESVACGRDVYTPSFCCGQLHQKPPQPPSPALTHALSLPNPPAHLPLLSVVYWPSSQACSSLPPAAALLLPNLLSVCLHSPLK